MLGQRSFYYVCVMHTFGMVSKAHPASLQPKLRFNISTYIVKRSLTMMSFENCNLSYWFIAVSLPVKKCESSNERYLESIATWWSQTISACVFFRHIQTQLGELCYYYPEVHRISANKASLHTKLCLTATTICHLPEHEAFEKHEGFLNRSFIGVANVV